MTKKTMIFFMMMMIVMIANSQTMIIKGIVTDSITGEALPSVSILLEGTNTGTTTDSNGNFSLSNSSQAHTLQFYYVGYSEKKIEIPKGQTRTLSVKLAPTAVTLTEAVIKPGKEKYSKKNNPAVDFVRNVINARNSNDPRNHDYFQYNRYEKIVLAMNDFHAKPPREDGKHRKFDFLANYVDTLEKGETILPLSEKEKIESFYYRKDPKTEKTIIQGIKSIGVDEIFSKSGIQQFLDEAFHEVNIFQNDVPLFLLHFVSPLSTMGPNYYKYYLTDTLNINGKPCVELGFAPFNPESYGFTGYLYITLDSTYFVQKVRMNAPRNINLNFVKDMIIEQTFDRLEDGTRLLTKDDITLNFKITENSKGMYARRLNIYTSQLFTPPEDSSIFNQNGSILTQEGADKKTEEFWASIRPPEAVKRNPNTIEKLMTQLRSVPAFLITEKVVIALASGYIETNKEKDKSKFDIGPVNTFISGNTVEGARFRLGGTTSTAFSKRLFLDGYAAYGTKDDKLKYDGLVEYSFIDKKEFRKEFPVHSIRLEYSYDINELGQEYMYTNKDNIFLAWKRQQDTCVTYMRNVGVTYYREHANGLGYGIAVKNLKEYATDYVAFNEIEANEQINPLNSYRMTELGFKFRFAPHEKFYQTRNFRYPITFDAPVFTLNHTMAQKGVLGSSYTYNRTDLGFEKRFWLSTFGFIDIIAKTGKVWNKVPYPLLILPNANLSYTIQPESYSNMNAMEFISDEYASWDLTYFMNGLIMHRLPVFRKLLCKEVFTFRGLYGNLTNKNNPSSGGEGLYLFPKGSYAMNGGTPYMEMGAGLENIFKMFRLDYVWRLSYLDHPGIQSRGIRFMLQLSF